MSEMTTRERVGRVYEHRTADRVPFVDNPWGATVERWRREGLPEGVDWRDHFGLDRVFSVLPDNSPRYPKEVLEETEEYVIARDAWGATMKSWKHAAGVPECLEFTITDPDSWRKAKARMTPSPDRINFKKLERDYPAARQRGDWLRGMLWFGFDITHSHVVGTERLLMAMIEQPDWVTEMFETELDLSIALLEMLWEAGYTFDEIRWPDDMGYKYSQFFSLEMYRELLKPFHKRAVEWAHSKGCKVQLHSCGDVRPFIPELLEIGIDALNPLEVKAGVDPVEIKRQYGDQLVLHGGINAVKWDDFDAITAGMRQVVPKLKEGGGYIFASDHSIPSTVSFEEMTRIVELFHELGSYE